MGLGTRHLTTALLLLACVMSAAWASHIDDTNGELSNFKWDKVVFRLMKDCSLDRIPDVR